MGKQDPHCMKEAGCNLRISIEVITTRRQSAKGRLFFKGRVLTAHSVSVRSVIHLGLKTWTLVAVQQSSMGRFPMELFVSCFSPAFPINWGIYGTLWSETSSILQPKPETSVALIQPSKSLTGLSPQVCCIAIPPHRRQEQLVNSMMVSQIFGQFCCNLLKQSAVCPRSASQKASISRGWLKSHHCLCNVCCDPNQCIFMHLRKANIYMYCQRTQICSLMLFK